MFGQDRDAARPSRRQVRPLQRDRKQTEPRGGRKYNLIMTSFLTLIFGALSGCFLSVLVGIVGSRRRIGFGVPFFVSLLFTPLVGLIVALLSDPLPYADRRWGCFGTLFALLGLLCLVLFVLLLAGAIVL